VMLKLNLYAQSRSILDRYEGFYPGSTKNIVADINKFQNDFVEFNRRYETLYMLLFRNQHLFDDLLEFANWRYETKFAK
jgi:hypothetical protein